MVGQNFGQLFLNFRKVNADPRLVEFGHCDLDFDPEGMAVYLFTFPLVFL